MGNSEQPALDLKEESRFKIDDVSADQFLELCELQRRGDVLIFMVEVRRPGSKSQIQGAYRVHYKTLKP